MARVFICYRRKKEAIFVKYIKKLLEGELGGKDGSVFWDRDIPLGCPNVGRKIRQEIDASDAVLVVMPPHWIDLTGEQAITVRDERDWVHKELAVARERECLVIPVLINGAVMPSPEDLQSLPFGTWLADHQGIAVSEEDAEHAVRKICSVVDEHVETQRQARSDFDTLDELWAKGNWSEARDHVERVLEKADVESSPLYRALSAKVNSCEALARLQDLLIEGEFEEAQKAVATLDLAETPEVVGTVGMVVDLAVGASREAGSLSALTHLKAELEELGVSGGARPRGWSQARVHVGQLIERRKQRFTQAETLLLNYEASRAKEALADLTDSDVDALRQSCDDWLAFLEAGRERDWDRAVAVLSQAGDEHVAATAGIQRWITRVRRCIPILETMAASDWVVETGLPWPGGRCPYSALELSPDTAMDRINDDIGSAAQPHLREAWDSLRRTVSRLKVDFGLYRVRDRVGIAKVIENFFSFPEGRAPDTPPGGGDFWTALHAALDGDLGVYFALQRDYPRALDALFEQLRETPHEPRRAHHVFLCAAALVQSGLDARRTDAWEMLALGLGATLADLRFWNNWWAEHRRVYPINSEDIATARLDIEREWMERMQRWAGNDDDQVTSVRTEIAGAKAMNESGGMVLRGSERHIAIFGRVGIRLLGLGKPAGEWTSGLRQAEQQRRACVLLSDLGDAFSLLQENRLTEALERVAAETLRPDGLFAERNPGLIGFPSPRLAWSQCRADLQSMILRKLALQFLASVPPQTEQAIGHWHQAYDLCLEASERMDLTEDVVKQVKGRAKALRTRQGTVQERLQALDDAVDLLYYCTTLGWEELTELLTDDYVDCLLDRAVFLSNELDREEDARSDAREAWRIRPQLLRVLQVLSWASLYRAEELFNTGKREQCAALLDEVGLYLDSGDKLYPEDLGLGKARTKLELFRKGGREATQAGGEEKLSLRELGPDAADSFEARLSDAALKEARADYSGAMDIYRGLAEPGATQTDAMRAELRGRMAWCYRAWITQQERSRAPASEVYRLKQEARECCPESDALADILLGPGPRGGDNGL